jgi:hypothetical protein
VEAFGVFLVAVLPGALYVWSFERIVGRWGISLADRVLRFVAVSALFQTVYLVAGYEIWSGYLHNDVGPHPRMWLIDQIRAGAAAPWWVVAIPLVYLGVPTILGSVTGRGVRSRHRFAQGFGRFMAGRDPAPRAWDHLFAARPAGIVRASLKAGDAWIGGLFGEASYAAGYPEPQDLYLETAYVMREDGSFDRDAAGEPVPLGSGLLVRWDELEFVEFFPTEEL